MVKESNTRSSLLWEVERILKEQTINDSTSIPDILIMENVPQVIKANGWEDWCAFLTELGYKNYAEILDAKDYGIPQDK